MQSPKFQVLTDTIWAEGLKRARSYKNSISEQIKKMKENYCDITMVLDRSGSMAMLADETRKGVNSLVAEQKKVPGKATITIHIFDQEHNTIVDNVNIHDCPILTHKHYFARGWTALLDAVGKAIVSTGNRLSAIPENERPSKVVFVVATDGLENSSHEYTKARVREMIKHQQDVYKWEFLFLGANQDAFTEGASLGVKGGNSMTYAANPVGTQSFYSSVSSNLRDFRSGWKSDMSFTDADLKAQVDAGAVPPPAKGTK